MRVLFICHGNICRSPMAQFVFDDLVKKQNLGGAISCCSCATSREELGNGVHRGTKKILDRLGIDCSQKRAVQLKKRDYLDYDYLVVMDQSNLKNALKITGPDVLRKYHLLKEFAGDTGDVADPWYTGDFETTYQDVLAGCQGLLSQIKSLICEKSDGA